MATRRRLVKDPETGKFKQVHVSPNKKKRGPRYANGRRKRTMASRKWGKKWDVVLKDLMALRPGEAYLLEVGSPEAFKVKFCVKFKAVLEAATPWQWQVSTVASDKVAIVCVP